jgi:putative transposase
VSRSKIIDRGDLTLAQLNRDLWLQVDTNLLTAEAKAVYLNRKEAIDLYVENEKSQAEIYNLTGVDRKNVIRLYTRCISYDPYGVPWGYRGLIPNKKLKPYELNPRSRKFNESRKTGEFCLLLEKYPEISDEIENLFFGRKKLSEPVMRPKYIHKKFVDKCKELGIPRNEYPFNTEHLGYRALCRHLEHLRDKHFGTASSRYGHDAEQKAKNSGIGQQNYPRTITPYQDVEFDGHRFDGIWVITIKTLEGDDAVLTLDRLWVLSFIDRATDNIIGRPHISLNKEYNATDVMIAAKKAVMPVQKMNLTIHGLSYQPTGGYPSERFKDIEWAVWDVIHFDNAKSHLAEMVRERLRNLIGCATCLGAVDKPMRRPHIERFHQTLTSSSMQRMVNTTGSHPEDPRRKEPEKMAMRYEMTFEHLEEILDVVVANYNGTPHGSLFYNSPLDALEQRLNKGMIPRLLSETKRTEFVFTQVEQPRTVRGSHKSGKRPYIEYMGVEYRNDLLANSAHLLNTKLSLHVNVDDLRTIRAYLPDGSEFGLLVAAGKWCLTPHSLQMRKVINILKRKKLIHFTQWDDPIFVYHEYLLTQAKTKKKRVANHIAKTKQVMKKREEEKYSELDESLVAEQASISALEKAREQQAKLQTAKTNTPTSHRRFKTITRW